MSRPTGPDSKSTPTKVQEPTVEIWKKSGDTTPAEALQRDKSSIRKPVKE